jgi:hypothetical protein
MAEEEKDSKAAFEAVSGEPTMTFSSFVMSLGMQALMALGEMPAPDGAEMPQNKEAAQQSIEILGVIKDKTKGNLEPDESRLLEEVLHNVRMAFVKG